VVGSRTRISHLQSTLFQRDFLIGMVFIYPVDRFEEVDWLGPDAVPAMDSVSLRRGTGLIGENCSSFKRICGW
jgi:hypothetical protein